VSITELAGLVKLQGHRLDHDVQQEAVDFRCVDGLRGKNQSKRTYLSVTVSLLPDTSLSSLYLSLSLCFFISLALSLSLSLSLLYLQIDTSVIELADRLVDVLRSGFHVGEHKFEIGREKRVVIRLLFRIRVNTERKKKRRSA
jgi:hypothetical protein